MSERPPITLRVVAEAVGVSVAAVSQALNGTGALGVETRTRIIETAASLGYVPNRAAAALRSGRTKTIGFVLDAAHADPGERRSALRTRMLDAVVREAARNDHAVTVFPADRADLLRGTPVDVLFHPGTERADDLVSRAGDLGIRVVASDFSAPVPSSVQIRTGYAEAVRAGLDVLAAGGARQIAFLADAPGSVRTLVGEEAYWQWCAEHHRDGVVATVDPRRRTLLPRLRSLQDDGVDAIWAFSEDGAELLLHLEETGAVVPRDIQIVTLCTGECALNARLGLTHACMHPERAPEALFTALAQGRLAPAIIDLPWTLVPGSTTRA